MSEKPKNENPGDEEDDEILLICMRATPKERAYVPGAVLMECGDCRHPVWVAPSGQKMVKEQDAKLACMECAGKRMKDDPDAKIHAPTPEQMEEIERTLRWDQLRRYRGKTDVV